MLNSLKIFIFLIIAFGEIHAQEIGKKPLFVWNFYTVEGETNNLTSSLSSSVEEVLTEIGCVVLQRKNYADLEELLLMEKEVEKLDNIEFTGNILKKATIPAEIVVTGKDINIDFNGNVILRISFEELSTKKIIKAKTIQFPEGSAWIVNKRRELIKNELIELLKPREEDYLIKPINESKILPEDILSHIKPGVSVDYMKELFGAPLKAYKLAGTPYKKYEEESIFYIYSFSNGSLKIESEDGLSIDAVTLDYGLNAKFNIHPFELTGKGKIVNGKFIGSGALTLGELKVDDRIIGGIEKVMTFETSKDSSWGLEGYYGNPGNYWYFTFSGFSPELNNRYQDFKPHYLLACDCYLEDKSDAKYYFLGEEVLSVTLASSSGKGNCLTVYDMR